VPVAGNKIGSGLPVVTPVSRRSIETFSELVKLRASYPRMAACVWDFFRSLARSSAER
jgi:hypothetical protein